MEGDYDAEKVSMQQAADMLDKKGIMAILYTSPTATKEKPRYRILTPFSKAREPDERYHYEGLLNAACVWGWVGGWVVVECGCGCVGEGVSGCGT